MSVWLRLRHRRLTLCVCVCYSATQFLKKKSVCVRIHTAHTHTRRQQQPHNIIIASSKTSNMYFVCKRHKGNVLSVLTRPLAWPWKRHTHTHTPCTHKLFSCTHILVLILKKRTQPKFKKKIIIKKIRKITKNRKGKYM